MEDFFLSYNHFTRHSTTLDQNPGIPHTSKVLQLIVTYLQPLITEREMC